MNKTLKGWGVTLLLLLSLAACRKETSFGDDGGASNGGGTNGGGTNGGGTNGGTSNAADLIGTWTFVSMHIISTTNVTASQAGTTVKSTTAADYTTINNTGTFTITATTMTSNAVAYDISTTLHVTSIIGGVNMGNTDFPWTFSSPPSTSTVDYKVIGKDSIAYPTGSLMTIGDQTTQVPAGGYRFSIANNVLTLKTSVYQSYSVPAQGISSTAGVIATSTLKRQ